VDSLSLLRELAGTSPMEILIGQRHTFVYRLTASPTGCTGNGGI
jgi:hypothetical protein